ncbi:MAG: HAD family hydrolase [[Clostridium] scindens]
MAAGKPSPDVYLLVAKEMGVHPEICLVFEDVPMGILAGKNAGMRVCAVDDDFSRPQEDKKKKLADYYIQDYYDIKKETYEVL